MKTFIIAIFVVIAALMLMPHTDPEDTIRVLTDQGYTEVRTGGYSWLGCSRDDVYHTEFSAISPVGNPVSGVVCRGFWGKGTTIRFY